MKTIVDYINESSTNNIILYHCSRQKINNVKDTPLFFFDNKKESNALYKNLKMDGSAYQYKFIYNSDINVLDIDESLQYIDDDLSCDLISNPNTNELIDMCNEIQNNINSNKCDGVTIIDYSQIDMNNDTDSILLFNPQNKLIKFELIK